MAGVMAFSAILAGCSDKAEEPAAEKEELSQAGTEEGGGYKDGTYEGMARGYKKGLNVEVTVKNGLIADVEVTDNNEDQPYLADSIEAVIPQIIETQSTEVDIVSEATKTCEGIAKAVNNALAQDK